MILESESAQLTTSQLCLDTKTRTRMTLCPQVGKAPGLLDGQRSRGQRHWTKFMAGILRYLKQEPSVVEPPRDHISVRLETSSEGFRKLSGSLWPISAKGPQPKMVLPTP